MDGSKDESGDWAPIARAAADDPAAHGLDRVGVIDVGSNSIRLVVFDGAARSPAYFYNEKVMCGLGADLEQTGRLSVDGRRRALGALRRFAALSEGMALANPMSVATAAMRLAEDGEEFREEVLAETGLDLNIIDGEEEARLSAQGVLLGWPRGAGLVCDIGGSSMELARIGEGRVWERSTSELGPLRLDALPGGDKARSKEITRLVAELCDRIGQHDRLFLVGGSWRAIARLDMHRTRYPLAVLHDYPMTPQSVRDTLAWLEGKDLDSLRREVGLSSARIRLVPLAGEVLREVLRQFEVRSITTSAYGIREGLLYERMPQRIRSRDPLIEAARRAERDHARVPGFGQILHEFVAPLFEASGTPKRLLFAACLLHDVSWRAHPDYRGEVVFDEATRGNLGGIDHAGRVFLGLALQHRYRNARGVGRMRQLQGLLDAEEIRDAEVLGRAMRFGAMFSLAVPERMGRLKYRARKHQLELELPPAAQPLFGEVAEARLASLAKAMDADVVVRRVES